ncbi:MAG: sigma-70 family RNA polymerase sigma factor [Niastella sp.]|nr:sigma-70 family RNA polymerase sigma factor [Niastella sp.]
MGNKESFAEIYQQYAPQVLRICMGYTNNAEQAKDFMQETFIKVWQHLENFRGASKMSTWLYRIAVNTCLHHWRLPKNKIPETLHENFDAADNSEHSEKEKNIQQLYKAIQQLNETDRLIISMVLEEISYPEIAETLNISEGNLRVKIHRIKQDLTKKFFSHE